MVKFTYEVVAGVNTALPGIYVHEIDGVNVYVGKYTNARRPFKAYARNVNGLIKGRPYHNKGSDYRRIHHELAAAVREGREVVIRIVENVTDAAARAARETALIAEYRALGFARCNATP
jgi:hypothetical protein